mmetsp:Transcript_19163/g.31789  ORF Transcript_19163/g.31789 Transcript_19163/m.31789 type:complete len:444 (-) Transcript_19163:88-1419(-)
MISLYAAALLSPLLLGSVDAFVPKPLFGGNHWRLASTSTRLDAARHTIPLLDLSDSDIVDRVTVPLPSSHLPDELTTLNLYGMELSRPVHKMMIQEAIEKGDNAGGGDGGATRERAYGHIVSKASDDSLVGAVGCAAEVLIQAARRDIEDESEVGMDAPVAVLYRGCYRFIVREVLKTIPYPVAIVEDLVDDDSSADAANNQLDGDDEDLQFFATMSVGELNRRIMQGVKAVIDYKIHEAKNSKVSPLEQSILEGINSSLMLPDPAAQNEQAEEAAAVFDVFSSSLGDIAPTPREQSFAIAMMAAEICHFDNEMRSKMLQMTDATARLRMVCQKVEEMVDRNQALKITRDLTEPQMDEKELKVGTPQLPPWAAQIKKGTRLEYYWNEEYDWAPGEVVQDPVKIMDEYLINLKFDSDGEVHTLPLNADDKVRWRPAGFNAGRTD